MAYLIGNLIGRFIFSAFVVWVVMFCLKKFKVKASLASLKRPLPLISIIIVFVLGLLAGTAT